MEQVLDNFKGRFSCTGLTVFFIMKHLFLAAILLASMTSFAQNKSERKVIKGNVICLAGSLVYVSTDSTIECFSVLPTAKKRPVIGEYVTAIGTNNMDRFYRRNEINSAICSSVKRF